MSPHDLEDFHRIRAVPWGLLGVYRDTSVTSTAGDVIKATGDEWFNPPTDAEEKLKQAAANIVGRLKKYPMIHDEPYEGTREQRIALRSWTSELTRRFVRDLSPTLADQHGVLRLVLHPEAEAEIRLLKQITRQFVIDGTTIGAQQHGQACIIQEVFDALYEDIRLYREDDKRLKVVPKRFHYLIHDPDRTDSIARQAADCIACLTENELVALHKRLRGIVGGSIVDPIVR